MCPSSQKGLFFYQWDILELLQHTLQAEDVALFTFDSLSRPGFIKFLYLPVRSFPAVRCRYQTGS
jgi:hypothetical protein